MRNKHILLIDDDQELAELLTDYLSSENFEVTCCFDGVSGLSQCYQDNIDIILLDVMMPGISGIELCKIIRERGDTAVTPVLILSARNDAESVMRGMEAGANDYLPKPILHHDLVSKVRTILTQSNA